MPNELDRRFRETAAAEGLLDVGYDLLDSPVGPLLVAATPRGVCRISYDADPEAQAERLARAYGVRVLRAPRAVDEVRRELDEYFAGRGHDFDLKLDLSAAPDVHPHGTRPARPGAVRRSDDVRHPRRARGKPARGARRGNRDEPEPDSDRAALPPGGRLQREPRGLRGRPRSQACPPAARGRSPLIRLALREPEDQQDENDDQQDADDSAWNHAIHLLDGESSRTCPLGGGVKPGFRERLRAAQ